MAARKSIMLGTAGHVDHGKTALVKLLTGCDTDSLAEEKARGLTIDLGFAPCRLADERIVGVVDVPGHVDFIRNMVAGAHGIDVVILVVAADDGIMPQTHEHLHILTLMGLRHGVVALTKIDLVAPERREEVTGELRNLLAGTFLAQAPICPLSNMTGEGYEGFFDALNAVVATCEERPAGGRFRLWLEDVFTIRGAGTVVTGIPSRGSVAAGQTLTLQPGNMPGRVRRLQVYGADATEGRAGECVALNIPDLDHSAVRRGMVLSSGDGPDPVNFAEGELTLLARLHEAIQDNLPVQLHVGTAAVSAHLALLESGSLAPGQSQMVQLRLSEAVPVVPGERFIVRAGVGSNPLTTLGGGRVLDISNLRLRRRRAWTLQALTQRKAAVDDPARWIEVLVRQSTAPVSLDNLMRSSQAGEAEAGSIVQKLAQSGTLVRATDRTWVHSEAIREQTARALEALNQFHTEHPQSPGITSEHWLALVNTHPQLFAMAVRELLETRQISMQGPVYARTGWDCQIADPERRFYEQIELQFRAAKWGPPSPAPLADALCVPAARVQKAVQWLHSRGALIRLEEGLFMHRDAVEEAKQMALQLFKKGASFTTMEFRDALNVSRKYAVPLLDYFDKVRFTVRQGNQRTPGVEARKG